ncbi:ATP-binding protein [Hyphococcus sp.]|uniref:ATP-binding protein n=1 Tax=Hyphococcus sp. TaxID=2038636 RepID=UPI002081CAB3|nr:MAG: ATPase [Marinicaulis sp.]
MTPHKSAKKSPFVRKGSAEPTAEAFDLAFQDKPRVGTVVSVTGSHALIMLDEDKADADRSSRPQLGAIMSVDAGTSIVLGLVSAMTNPAPSMDAASADMRIIEIELIGEFTKPTINAPARFRRGVSAYPTLGDNVHVATRDELTALFAVNGSASVRVGVVKQDAQIPATVNVDEIFSRHCAVLGTTGAGKSCAIALLLRAVLQRFPHAHIVVLDPHNEYSKSFGDGAVVFDPTSFNLPYWMLTFDELVEVLYPGRARDSEEVEILADLLPAAKKLNLTNAGRGGRLRTDMTAITVDTPTPYRISELLGLIDKSLGGLDGTRNIAPYKRLRSRIYTISQDARYAFMFGGLTVQDTLKELLSELFRIPVDGKPVSVIELGGLPGEVVQVVVSVVSRLAFEFGLWSNGAAPIALVCEDAHRYAPANPAEGFGPTRRSLVRIAKEGRKTGVSLWIASQRPTELDPTILSQCNTIFAMRLANQADQDALRAAVPDASTSLLSCLPSLGLGEAIAVGEGVPMPTRIRFDALPSDAVPRSLTACFTDGWSVEIEDNSFIDRIVEQWRAQRMLTPDID